MSPARPHGVKDACRLLNLGDSITTHHISPAGSIHRDSPAAGYLMNVGIRREQQPRAWGGKQEIIAVINNERYASLKILPVMAAIRLDKKEDFATMNLQFPEIEKNQGFPDYGRIQLKIRNRS
ncbi:aconitate hydratase [Populus alba x Populus x berolinensis]|uniref:Aconitate hydratase n=2 Tax=Populus alba x Populus x berolinensis TaxID=444605 RepID=A0AAD6RGJ8_9ROSI|nr:aconitate hydratase [Populus alba x Populus x berolinensis]